MMAVMKDEEIDVARLMDEIREAALALPVVEGAKLADEAQASSIIPHEDGGADVDVAHTLPRLVLRAEKYQRSDDRYALDELLQYYDSEFVDNAYRMILKREPDAAGRAHYLEQLRDGRLSRIDILRSLRSSAEGRERGVRVIGLPTRRSLRRLYRLPAVGYFVEWLVELARLPVHLREARELEAHAHLQQKRLFAELEKTAAQADQMGADINRLCEEIERAHAEMRVHLQRLYEESARLAESEEERRQQLSEQFEERAAGLDERLRAGMKELSEQMQAHAIQFSQHSEQVAQRLQATRAELLAQEKRTLKLLEGSGEASSSSSQKERAASLAEEKQRLSDSFYAEFEEHFRGSREEIMKRLRVYLPHLREAGVEEGVLDIGTGRGEWLELLREEGIAARGIDTNLVQVAACRARGLEVSHADALSYLRNLPDNTLRAVTGFHIIEHLEFDALVSLMDEAMRVLVPDGLLIFETPNPENVSVTGHNFYVDPTHRNPLPVPLMKFLFEARGYCKIRVMRLHPSETPQVEGEGDLIARFNDYFYGPMDYSIIGSKA